MEKEQWVDINESYSISSYGRVLGPNKMLKNTYFINNFGRGQYIVTIHNKIYSLANLLGKYFLPNAPNMKKNKIVFINNNTKDISLSNLRWMTSEDYSKLAKKRKH